jgi:periplasmic mercuric ion binding protein
MTKALAAALFGISLLISPAAHADEKTVTLSVPGMDCSACPIIVKSSLEAVSGVIKAVVTLADKTAVVTFDDQKTVPSALIAATGHVGYPSAIKG